MVHGGSESAAPWGHRNQGSLWVKNEAYLDTVDPVVAAVCDPVLGKKLRPPGSHGPANGHKPPSRGGPLVR